MAGYQVETDFDPAPVGFTTEPIEVPVSPVARRDPAIVSHVIAGILERGHKTGVNPHRINAQPLKVIQFLNYPGDVSDAVSIGVVETLGVNLVKNGLFEPGGCIELVHMTSNA
jgi:hypothetical protein